MICPFCGEEIDSIRVLETNQEDVEYVIWESGRIEEVDRDIADSEIHSYKFPCCGGIIEEYSFLLAELLLKGKALLVPNENCPDPVNVGGTAAILITYDGKPYISVRRVRGFSGWSHARSPEFQVFYEVNYYTEVKQGVKTSKLVKKVFEKHAKCISKNDLVVKEER